MISNVTAGLVRRAEVKGWCRAKPIIRVEYTWRTVKDIQWLELRAPNDNAEAAELNELAQTIVDAINKI